MPKKQKQKPYLHGDEAVKKYGFKFGAAEVTRAFQDTPVKGAVCIMVSTPYSSLSIYVSKSGRSIRVTKDA